MSTYFRYHINSGHIDTKLTVPDEEALAVYERPGYDFVESNLPFGDVYVANGEVLPRVRKTGSNVNLHGTPTEPRTITGLPDDCWVTIDGGDPLRATNGIITIMPRTEEVIVEMAGKYNGPGWRMVWDELDSFKEIAKSEVDAVAERKRQEVITPGSGQAMTYLRKADAARLFLAGQSISEAQMKRLTDEAALRGVSVEVAAQGIVQIADQWENIDAEIDSIRLHAKAQIDLATSGEAIELVFKNLVWPTI